MVLLSVCDSERGSDSPYQDLSQKAAGSGLLQLLQGWVDRGHLVNVSAAGMWLPEGTHEGQGDLCIVGHPGVAECRGRTSPGLT